MKVGIISDSSSCLEYAPFKHNIKIARTSIFIDDNEYIDGVDINAHEFYNKIKNLNFVPSTSAPTIGRILEKIDELKSEGCTDILYFPISFNLSDYGKNLSNVLNDIIVDTNIHVINSNLACIMEGLLAKYAEELIKRNYSIEEIKVETNNFINSVNTYFVVDDLNFLIKNGRLNFVSGFVGNLIKIKPILTLDHNGEIKTLEKVRTTKRAIERIINLSIEKNKPNLLYIVLHSNDELISNQVKEQIICATNNKNKVITSIITPTIGAHVGGGVIGVATIDLDNLRIN